MPYADPEKRKEYHREYQRRYRAADPERAISNWRKSHENNKENRLEAARKYKKENRSKMTALQRKRHCAKLLRTPIWANLSQISEIYKICDALTKCTGIKCEVDHEIPLQGKLVSGLHVPENLQIMTKINNLQKGSKWLPSK